MSAQPDARTSVSATARSESLETAHAELTASPITAMDIKPIEVQAEVISDDGEEPVADPKTLARTVRRIDVVVLPVMTLLLAWSYIDRANMGLAAVAGMAKELELVGFRYSTTLLVFFPGYALFVLPSNYILSKTSVRYWLSCLSICFGLFTLAMGLVQNYASLAVMRFFLGVFEAGVFPTVIVVVSSWYPRYYLAKRIALVFCGASLLSSLAGILAYAFSRINAGGYAGWRWIFLLEGIITVVVTIGAFFIIDEYPQKSKFLSVEQRDIAVRLIARDRNEQAEKAMTVRLIFHHLRDWKLWLFGIMYMFAVVATYGMAYFMPIILNARMGFSGALSQVLTTPPYFYAFFLSTGLAWISDRVKIRSLFIAFFSSHLILGLALVRWGPNTGSQYLGLFFTLGGAQGNVAFVIGFGQNNATSRIKRSVSSGLQLSLGAIGGIIGSTVFRSQDSPYYTPGLAVVMSTSGAIAVIAAILAFYFRSANRRQEQTGEVLEEQEGFRYTL